MASSGRAGLKLVQARNVPISSANVINEAGSFDESGLGKGTLSLR
jgi:hypothetical protein